MAEHGCLPAIRHGGANGDGQKRAADPSAVLGLSREEVGHDVAGTADEDEVGRGGIEEDSL